MLGEFGKFGTILSSLSLAAIRADLVAAGALELFLPSTFATTAYQSYRIYPSVTAIGYPVGLLCGALSPYAETEVLTNQTFDNSGAGWTKIGAGVTFSGAAASMTAGLTGIRQGSLFPWRLYRLGMTITQTLTSGSHICRFANPSNGSSFSGTEYRYGSSSDFSAHLLTDAASPYGAFFGISGGGIPTGTLILTAPSCKLIGGGYICRQATDGNRPSLYFDGRVYYLGHTSGQKLTAYVPSSLGATCTIVYASPGVGAQALYNVPVTSNAVDLVVNHSGLVILPSSATSEQVSIATAIMGQLAWRTAV